MASISSIFTLTHQAKHVALQARSPHLSPGVPKLVGFEANRKLLAPIQPSKFRVSVVAEHVSVQGTSVEAARRVYSGNFPRTVNNDELKKIVEEHGAVEKVEVVKMLTEFDYSISDF